jgi:DNA repair protein RecO (recombination protein O)
MIQNLRAIVLRKREYGEKDLMLTVLTDAGERMEVVVKGANLPASRRRAHLESMNLIEGSIYKSTHHQYLQSVQVKNSFMRLKESVDGVLRLSVFLEILDRGLQEKNPEPQIYTLLEETLQSLNTAPHAFLPDIALIKLAHLLGFLPSFKHCNACHQSIEAEAHWDQSAGTLACPACRNEGCRPLPLKYRKAFEFFRCASTEECRKILMQKDEAQLLREWIPSFFSLHLDRPLKSLSVSI